MHETTPHRQDPPLEATSPEPEKFERNSQGARGKCAALGQALSSRCDQDSVPWALVHLPGIEGAAHGRRD